MKSSNLFKRLFAETAVFATLATTGVTATVHAADSSSVSGISTEEMNQYFKDHGAQNWSQQEKDATTGPGVKNTVDSKTKKYGYYTYTVNNGQFKPTTVFQFNKYPSQMNTVYSLHSKVYNNNQTYFRDGNNNLFIEGVEIQLWRNGIISITQGGRHMSQSNYNEQAKFLETHGMNHIWLKLVTLMSSGHLSYGNDGKYINITQFYHKFLHIDINKILTQNQPSNWKSKYTNWEPTKGVFKDGYNKAKVNKKLDWALRKQEKASNEMEKIAKQTTLKDQRQYSATNNFDNSTIK